MTEAATGNHGYAYPARSDQGREYQRNLITHTAGRMLIDFRIPDAGQVEDCAGPQH